MTTRQRNLLALLLIGVAAVAAFVAGQPHGPAARGGILSAVPRDAFLVATIDVQALRASPIAEPLLGSDAAKSLLGAGVGGRAGALEATCGFDPLARVRELAIAIPEGGDTGDFGLVAMGDLTEVEFASCAEKIITARGGRVKKDKRGSFTTIGDDGESASVVRAEPKIALRDGGPFLIGRGAWLDAMIDAADGLAPSVLKNEAHAAIRDVLAPPTAANDPSARAAAPTIVATAILPKSLRERLKREMGAELGLANAGATGNAAMGGVLGVEMAGIAITAAPSGSDTTLAAELRCESAEACVEVKKLIDKKRLAFSQDFGVRIIGLGPLLDHLETKSVAATLSATTRAPTDELAKAVRRLLDLRADRRPTSDPNRAVPSSAPPIASDVVVPRPNAADASPKGSGPAPTGDGAARARPSGAP